MSARIQPSFTECMDVFYRMAEAVAVDACGVGAREVSRAGVPELGPNKILEKSGVTAASRRKEV
jgi:hypothetical protein